MFCINCGTENPDHNKICSICGYSLEDDAEKYDPTGWESHASSDTIPQKETKPRKKSTGKVLGIVAAVLALVVALAVFLYLEVFTVRVFLRTESASYTDSGNTTKTCEYDKNGHLLKEISYQNETKVSLVENEYDDNGNCVETTTYNFADGQQQMTYCTEYVYDSKGHLTESTSFDATGKLGSIEYTCNSDGDVTEEVFRDKQGAETGERSEYTYDKNGNCLTYEHYYNNELAQAIEYEYDKDDNETLRTTYDYSEDPRGEETNRVESAYDKAGNLTEEKHYYGNELFAVKTWEYDKKDNLLESSTVYYGDNYENGKWETSYVCEYDDNGHREKGTSYINGVEAGHDKITCDKYGNPIKYVSYDGDGNRTGNYSTYTYEKLRMNTKKAYELQEENSAVIIDDSWF